MTRRRLAAAALAFACLLSRTAPARAQVDPERRRLLQLGLDKNLSGHGPEGAYIFYYSNTPHFVKDRLTLRYALAPTYIDSELGVKSLLPKTDAGLDVAGGGFADSYAEVRQGQYLREESFAGHSASLGGTLYPQISPDSWVVPVNVILRAGFHPVWYVRQRRTDQNFVLPEDHTEFRFRGGIRVGGEPPEIMAHRAAELSFWYDSYLRDRHGGYGFHSDRTLEQRTDLGFGRLRASWKFENRRQAQLTMEGGISSHADRLDAYRIGGLLPFASEFALSLPGYYNGELTARRYALFGGDYFSPFIFEPSLASHYFVQVANVSFLPGLEQTVPWNEGAGMGVAFDSLGGILRIETNYAYGFEAIRSGHRGAHSVSVLMQLDLVALKKHSPEKNQKIQRGTQPQGLDWLYNIVRP